MKFELLIADPDISGGSIPITWCLDREALAEIQKHEHNNIVIVVAPEPTGGVHRRKSETRYVVPLRELMAYVIFKKAGPAKVFGFISHDSLKDLKREVFRTDIVYDADGAHADTFDHRIINDDATGYVDASIFDESENLRATPLSVNIPDDYFAPEPTEWEKKWVLWLIPNKGADQCEFRQRRIFAYTVQPIVFIINWLLRLFVTLLALYTGQRNFSIKYLLHLVGSRSR